MRRSSHRNPHYSNDYDDVITTNSRVRESTDKVAGFSIDVELGKYSCNK